MRATKRILAGIVIGACLSTALLPAALAAGNNAKTEVIWVNDPNAVYEQPQAVIDQFLQAPMEFDTPAFGKDDPFTAEGRGLTTYDDMMAYLRDLTDKSEYAALITIGTSFSGRDIPLVLFSKEGYQTLEAAAETAKPIVWYQAQIHGHEPASGEGALAVAKDLATGEFGREVLDHVVVAMVPRYNIDGSVGFVRTMDNGNDGNRDHINMENPETRAAHMAFQRLKPAVAIDGHEYYVQDEVFFKIGEAGSLSAYDALVSPANNLNIPDSLRKMSRSLFIPNVSAAMEQKGLRSSYYYTTNEAEYDQTGQVNIYEMGMGAKSGANAYGLQNTFSFLVETRGIGIGKATFARRVASQVVVFESIIKTTAENSAAVLEAVASARQEIVSRGEARNDGDNVVISAKAQNTGKSTIDVIDIEKLEIVPIEMNFISTSAAVPDLVRQRPTAYLLPAQYSEVAEKLAYSGAEVKRLSEDITLPVQTYSVTDSSISATAYQGHYRNSVTIAVGEQERTFQKGDFVLTMAQPSANLIAIALEPESEDGFVLYNYLPAAKGEEIPVYRYLERISFQTEPVTLEALQAVRPTVTRGQFVEALYARFGSDSEPAAHAFTDVPAENRAVAWAVSQSVVSGSHGKFMPEQAITREQAAVMLANYAKASGAEAAESAELQKALDYGAIASWARSAAAFCQSNGTITVGADGRYRPQDPLSPVEVQLILSVFAAKLG